MESHKAGFPPFPHSLEIPSGFPHSHGLDDEIRDLEATAQTSLKLGEERAERALAKKNISQQLKLRANKEFSASIRLRSGQALKPCP
jgi:hypothetical protein